MNEELQGESDAIENDYHVETNFDVDTGFNNEEEANPEVGSELATETETTENTNEQPSITPNAQAAINKQHRKYREEERKRIEVEQQLAETQRQIQEMQAAQNKPPTIPEMPDQFDPDYDEKLRARDEAIQRNAEHRAQQDLIAQQQQQAQQLQQQQKQKELSDKWQSYVNKATELGISQQELVTAGNEVGAYGVSEGVQMAILNDPNGPLITKYLAANPTEIDLLRLDPINAGMNFAEIKRKAVALKPKTSSASKPPTQVQGGGADPETGKYQYSAGATFT